MKKNDKSRYAVLGILFQGPNSGYEIGQLMRQSTNHFWQESDASIYPTLKTLEAEGKVTSRSEFVGKRERNIFSITPTGKKEFSTWMATPATKEKHRNELLLKLFFGTPVNKQVLQKHLKQELKDLETSKKAFESIDASILEQLSENHPQKVYWQMTLRYGTYMQDAAIMWIKESLKSLNKK